MAQEPMTDLWYTETTKKTLLDRLEVALKDELTAKTTAAGSAAFAEVARARVLKHAYEDGKIEGKNAADRERAETVYLADHETYQATLRIAHREEHAAIEATIRRKLVEEEISLTRAAWYGPMRATDGAGVNVDD